MSLVKVTPTTCIPIRPGDEIKALAMHVNPTIDAVETLQEEVLVVQQTLNPTFMYGEFQGLISATEYDESFTGTFVVGVRYEITTLETGDDFSNIGGTEASVIFRATGTTPTTWTHGSVVKCYGDLYISKTFKSSLETGFSLVFKRESAGVQKVCEYYNLSDYELTEAFHLIDGAAVQGVLTESWAIEATYNTGLPEIHFAINSAGWSAADAMISNVPYMVTIYERDIK